MNTKPQISEQLLTEAHQRLVIELIAGRIAPATDMLFMKNTGWLKDAAVIDVVTRRNGAWEVRLIFAHYEDPLQLIVRSITRCYSEQVARNTAYHHCLQAAKDNKGTLAVTAHALGLNDN